MRDIHAEVINQTVSALTTTIDALDPERPLEALDGQIDDAIATMVELIRGHDPIEVIEQSRLCAFPWQAGQPVYQAGVENGWSCTELVAIVASKSNLSNTTASRPGEIIESCLEIAGQLLRLGMIRATISAEPTNPLALIGAKLQASELMMRGSSYSELLETTTRTLFGEPTVDANLREAIGFGAPEAISVLGALHDLQVANMNRRQEAGLRAMDAARRRHELGIASREDIAEAAKKFDRACNPDSAAASVSVADLVRSTGLADKVVMDVLDAFTWRPDVTQNVDEEVRAFLSGNNPLRVSPVVRTKSSRALLIHPVLTQGAIRERLESALRSSAGWEQYQNHRGALLEQRTRQAFERLVGPACAWHSLLYYVPASEAERQADPVGYSKRVEGDHLIVLDDVAIVIEDKAVALSPQSRSGASFRLQKDLTGIITKASEQADRLVRRIQADGGLRIHGEGWIDLSHIREFHTVAVSLDDLTSTSTATAQLVQAGLIATESVPWTVSIHDLDLIAELSAHPAEFLLYLRRRRHPLATVLYTAPDELDLFLYFFEAGLYVEEDPHELRAAFPFLPEPTPAELDRWRKQIPSVVTSRTDPLDAWYQEDFLRVRAGKSRTPSAPSKPRRTPSPLDELVEQMDELGAFGRTSIAATLLSGDRKTQQQMSRHGRDVVRASDRGTLRRSVTVPVQSLSDGGWLLVWATCPTEESRHDWEREMREYVRVKGHQLRLARGALFAFDGASGEMFAVYSETVPNDLSPSELANAKKLLPLSALRPVEQVKKAMSGQRTQPRRKKKHG
ncbi:hypothetical protein ACUWEX_09285 [Okibacterium fritillariae]|uniref:hypothetical protein n=1 Tax=Okibacterium fritillariae TaxID=123320 RepID=UPI0040554C93